jgi:hypothetical protein
MNALVGQSNNPDNKLQSRERSQQVAEGFRISMMEAVGHAAERHRVERFSRRFLDSKDFQVAFRFHR